ncbi:MAG: rhodanese-like domain-containing protein [Saprospiraceae bacterium]|nr:rhodanese-like domain-containing protein [Saprospiraceae bacterium]
MDITVQELKKRLDEGDNNFVLIDVREPYEREEFNIGGQLVPVGSVMGAIPSLMDHKDKEVVVYCRSGNRSGMAKQLLVASGFTNVRNLLGGMLTWRENFG